MFKWRKWINLNLLNKKVWTVDILPAFLDTLIIRPALSIVFTWTFMGWGMRTVVLLRQNSALWAHTWNIHWRGHVNASGIVPAGISPFMAAIVFWNNTRHHRMDYILTFKPLAWIYHCHFHPLQAGNCCHNSRFVVNEDDLMWFKN